MSNLLDTRHAGNSAEPKWIVLHGGAGSQRRRWGPDMARLLADLVERYGWVTWREGTDAHVKHRALMSH